MKAVCDRNIRLDAFMASLLPDLSRAKIVKAARDVKVNSSSVPKLSKALDPGDEVEFELDGEALEEANAKGHGDPVELDIIYEDDELAVICKEQGICSHHGNGCFRSTIEDSLFFRLKESERPAMAEYRYGIVHRLDKDTSGLMVVAKTAMAASFLSDEFKNRRVRKEYIALSSGFVPDGEGRIVSGLRRSQKNRLIFETCPEGEGKLAITEYRALKYYGERATLLSVNLKTGRTHQIRAHLKSIGNPIVGDCLYGNGVRDGFTLMLHAARLSFRHPLKGRMEFESPAPERFSRADAFFRDPK